MFWNSNHPKLFGDITTVFIHPIFIWTLSYLFFLFLLVYVEIRTPHQYHIKPTNYVIIGLVTATLSTKKTFFAHLI